MNIKFLAASAALMVVSVAQATWRFDFGYGDASLAAANGGTVGGLIEHGATLKIPTRGNNFTVQVYGMRTSGNPNAGISGGSAIVAYDLVNSSNHQSLSDASSFMHGKIKASTSSAQGTIANYGSGMPVFANDGTARTGGHLRSLHASFRGVHTGNTSSPRTAGLSTQFAVGSTESVSGNNMRLAQLERVRLFDMTFTSQMDAGQSYGFGSGETGLGIFCTSTSLHNAPGGSTSFLGGVAGWGDRGARLNLHVVPEPGSLVALAFGALVLMRRRSK